MAVGRSLSARALSAQQFALEVTGNHIANVNTAGYSRRTVDFAAAKPESSRSAVECRAQGRSHELLQILRVVEAGIGTTGNSLDGRFTEMFGSFSRLADAPTSSVARADVLNTASISSSHLHFNLHAELDDALRR